jgi:hypothetical protein
MLMPLFTRRLCISATKPFLWCSEMTKSSARSGLGFGADTQDILSALDLDGIQSEVFVRPISDVVIRCFSLRHSGAPLIEGQDL